MCIFSRWIVYDNIFLRDRKYSKDVWIGIVLCVLDIGEKWERKVVLVCLEVFVRVDGKLMLKNVGVKVERGFEIRGRRILRVWWSLICMVREL